MRVELTKMQPLLQEARTKTEAMMADLAVRKEKVCGGGLFLGEGFQLDRLAGIIFFL